MTSANNETSGAPSEYWRDAANVYNNWDSPLSPCGEDLHYFRQEALETQEAGDSPLRVLMLGVTPGLAAMNWPTPTVISAMDKSQTMIDTLWPGDLNDSEAGFRRKVALGNWLGLDVPEEERFDLVVGDGPFHNMVDRQGYEELAAVLRRSLRSGGRLVMRFFIAPDQPESPDDLIQQLHEGAFPSFHVFKLHLLMALQQEPDVGVRLSRVWEYWQSRDIDTADLAQKLGWTTEEIDTIRAYDGKETRLCFVNRGILTKVLGAGFRLVCEHQCSYPMGDQCPVMVWERSPDC